MGTWQIVGTAWRSARKALKVVGFVALVQLVLGLCALPLVGEEPQPTGPQALGVLALVLVQFFLLPLIQGGCLSFANATLIQPPAPFESFTQGAKRIYLRLLGFEALTLVAVLLLAIVAVVLFGLASLPEDNPALGVALTILAAVPVGLGLYLTFLIVTLTPAAIAAEFLGVFAAIKKGLKIGRGALGKLALLTLALGLTLIPAILVPWIPTILRGNAPPDLGTTLMSLVLQSVVGALSMLLFAVAYVQLYRQRANLTFAR